MIVKVIVRSRQVRGIRERKPFKVGQDRSRRSKKYGEQTPCGHSCFSDLKHGAEWERRCSFLIFKRSKICNSPLLLSPRSCKVLKRLYVDYICVYLHARVHAHTHTHAGLRKHTHNEAFFCSSHFPGPRVAEVSPAQKPRLPRGRR